MGQVHHLFQQFFSEIEAVLSQAQAAGRVDKYQLEVVLSAWQPSSSQTPSHNAALCSALLGLLRTLQEIVDLCSPPGMKCAELKSYPPLPQPTDDAGVLHEKPQRDEIGDENAPHVNRMEEHLAKDIQGEFGERLPPPQLPTTKETEAANVLMNLSGKAADRVGHARLVDTCLPHQDFADVGRPYSSPSGPRCDPGVKREFDEVPQINEKDLLPLATQVLCQFCSRQCEDLVELHEHVLAVHNVPETEPPLMPSYKKLKSHAENEDVGDHVEVPAKDSSLTSISNSDHKYTEEKKLKRRQRLRKGSKEVSNNNTEQSGHFKEEDVQGDGSATLRGDAFACQLDAIEPPEQLHQEDPNPAVRVDGLCDKDEDWLKCHDSGSMTELTPVGGDALAIAVESSQIKDFEAKVTVSVCLGCSSGYTDSQEFRDHACGSDRPFVRNFADGSVALSADPVPYEDHGQLSDGSVWYFPEFYIERRDGLQIVHSSSGRRLQLYTSFQPAYLSEQMISFRCPTCENDCDSLGRFLEHLMKGPCMFRCPECNLVYITHDKLQKHRASLHPTLEDRTCPNCRTVFEKRHQRNKHLKTKCSQRHVCLVCGGILKNEYNLRVHMQSHEERSHKCSQCGAAFHRRAILKRHMMRHSGTKPHACSQCEAKFYTRQHLKTHMDRHNGLRRFPCSSCDKAYYSKHDRDTHYSKVHCKTVGGQKSLTVHEQKFVNEHLIE